MNKYKTVLRVLAFLLVLALAVTGVQSLFKVREVRSYQNIRGFYKEKRNSLDAVFLGASNVYAFYQAPLAWADHGIAVYPLSVPNMPAPALKYMVAEARKTQPDALYIINLNNFKTQTVTVEKIHFLVDYMPLSLNKVRMINALCAEAGIRGKDKLEFYMPIIRFHSGWDELEDSQYTRSLNGLKSALTSNYFRKKVTDFSDVSQEAGEAALGEEQAAVLEDFLAYCEERGVRLLFVTVPQMLTDTEELGRLNTMERLVRERGYDCLDLMDVTVTGIRKDTDFYNANHTNVHGSLKFTEYLARYLTENYGFGDKRGEKSYKSWDKAAETYIPYLMAWSLPLEREHAARDYSLAAPSVTAAAAEDGIRVSWTAADGAESYEIYRKASAEDGGAWRFLTAVEGAGYIDRALTEGETYTYTVVPVRTENGAPVYGCFNVLGVQISMDGAAPAADDDMEEEGG